MDVILTHEQADFDALGSLLASALLENHRQDRPVTAVTPRRINRNGRSFLTIYGVELPFCDPQDLPAEPVDSILLVDTQSLITLKGVGAYTRVSTLDHHPVRPDLPPDWKVTFVPTGACTTALVEDLQEYGIPFTPIQATLMLLGIYEDTGSLSYDNTTPRDVRAAAYLLEQGASLNLLADYLNPPLSAEQQQVYQRLLADARTHIIQGHTIIVSLADARELTDEISSVAHKLRDLFEPDALFLLVLTNEGVRLVARSSIDQINVAAISAGLNGGGHGRAAAALIKLPDGAASLDINTALEPVYRQLMDLLQRHVQPGIQVAQIMSPHPHLISPRTSAQEAALMMQRYGYEGFPVVKEHKVIGLLTRRAVDRANSHRLNLAAESLMESGEVAVHPEDSLEHLQEVMVSSGWGQIPVTDPQTGKVVGIVTRTDLLKTLTAQPGVPVQRNLADRLEGVLPPGRLALLKAVAEKAHDLHMALYIVGGFVRDLLLERPNIDFDLVVEGEAITLAKALAAQYGGRVVSHARFGTAKWHSADQSESLDLVSARTEYYERPTALPTVERGSIKADLHRRDFTINTLAVRLDGKHYGELYNYWGGLNDLRQGTVRVLHALSFVDDPTRLLRAVRFEQRFGFSIEARTLQLYNEALRLLEQVSGDRLRHELDLILAEEKAGDMLARLDNLGILKAIHPGLGWGKNEISHLPEKTSLAAAEEWALSPLSAELTLQIEVAYLVWLMALPPDRLLSIGSRLRFPHGLTEALLAASALVQDLPALEAAPPSQVVDRLDRVPRVAVFAVYLTQTTEALCQNLQNYALRWRLVKPFTNGRTLQALGLPPSGQYRTILKTLRAAWLDGKIHNEDEEKELLGKLLVWK